MAVGHVDLTRADEGHAGLLADFYREVWDPDATPEGVRRSLAASAETNPHGRGRLPPTFLYIADKRVIGHVGTIPLWLWNGSSNHEAHWIKGLWVLPQWRNGPVGFQLLKEAVRHLGCALVLVVQPAARRLFLALGFVEVGVLPNFLRVLAPRRVLKRLNLAKMGLAGSPKWLWFAIRLAQLPGIRSMAGAMGAGIFRLTARVSGHPPPDCYDTVSSDVNLHDYDELWQAVRGEIAGSPCRDGTYFKWRYGSSQDVYQHIAIHRGSALVAAGVVRRPTRAMADERLSGIRVATLSEAIFHPEKPETGLALVASAERVAREMGADALLCSAGHSSLVSTLRRRAFVRLPGNLHFLVRDPDKQLGLPSMLNEWWLTRGDMSADEAF